MSLALVFTLLERWCPAVRGRPLWRRGARIDIVYWLAQPFVFKPISRACTAVAAVAFACFASGTVNRQMVSDWILLGHGPLAQLPLGAQVVLAILVADFVSYWCHRAFHGKELWSFHAIHHSSTDLDWLASARSHPVNEIVSAAVHAIVLVALGFRGSALAGALPLLTLYAILLHANVPWTFGPLRYVLASPAFHRWHHSAEQEGLDKNFAGLLPVWDLMFGTFHMPSDRTPQKFGVVGEHIPEGFFQQLLWPFRNR